MYPERDEKIKVTDKRHRFDEAPAASPPSPPPSGEPSTPESEPVPPPEPISFAGFILSMGTSALIHLGQEPDPISGKKEIRMERAREVIDLLSLLEEKTKGNLSADEESLMSRLLFTLRMKFVETEKRAR
jgi:hypothetical protein